MSETTRKVLRIAVRLVGPALLAFVLLRIERPSSLWAALADASLPLLAVSLLANAPALHLKVERWRLLLRRAGSDYPLGRAYQAVLSSQYVGMMTPGRVGDVMRVQYLRHDLGTPYAAGVAVSAMDRICDLYVLAAFVALGFGHFAAVIHGELAYLTWGAVAFSTLAPLALFAPGLAKRLTRRLYVRLIGAGGADGLERFDTTLRAQVGVAVRRGLPLTVAAFLVNYGQGWLIARALGLRLGFGDVVGMLAITSLLGLIPISISGIGVREMFLALVFPALGLTAEQGVAFGLIVFVSLYLIYVPVGFVAWQIAPPPVAPK